MLKELTIKNYALIEQLDAKFTPGLNMITGETGAGKSILIGALGLLLGVRAQKEVIRKNRSIAVVEGIFELADHELPDSITDIVGSTGSEIILRREVHENGRSRCFVNDSPVVLSVLESIGDNLVDLHGQHDHQALLKVENHLIYLDKLGVSPALLLAVGEKYQDFKQTQIDLQKLRSESVILEQKRELLSFQVHEIEALGPDCNEEEELNQREKILKNAEKIHSCYQQLSALLYDGEDNALEKLTEAENRLADLSGVDDVFSRWQTMCHSSCIEIEEIMNAFQTYIARLEFDPDHLESIRTRLSQYNLLKKKYGPGTMDMLARLDASKSELKKISTLGEQIEQLELKLKEQSKQLKSRVLELSAARKQAAGVLAESITSILSELGLSNCLFEVHQEWNKSPDGPLTIDNQSVQVRENGAERIEFLISLNPGEPPKPLHKVASGGEISRIMLAFKTALAKADSIPVLIFDEIDTGVSGRIARVVGQNLLKLSENHQLLCITHLPQIASLGQAHYVVEKESDLMDTRTRIKRLTNEERVQEIGKLLGGESVTDSVLQNARELLSVS